MKYKIIITIILALILSVATGGFTFAQTASISAEPTPSSSESPSPTPSPTPSPSSSPTLPILPPTPLVSEEQNRGSSISQPNQNDLGEIGTTPVPTPSTSPEPTPHPSPSPSPKATDGTAEASEGTAEKPKDISPPTRITDLRVQHVGFKGADIAWTAPSDNEGVAGYDVRISRQSINETNWPQTIQLPVGSNVNKSGELEVIGLTDLPSGSTIYLAVRAYDKAGNTAGISNVLAITTKTLNNEARSTNLESQSTGGEVGALTPKNAGVVRMVLQLPNGGVPEDLIFINFINQNNGLSFGSVANNGLVAVALPEGRYGIKLLLPDNFSEPDNLPTFEVTADLEVNLGSFRLNSGTADSFLASVERPGGTAKALAFIIQLLFEILKELKSISARI